jgi:NADH:ubiquinone oxidoreductase subunit 3 (subunit A)
MRNAFYLTVILFAAIDLTICYWLSQALDSRIPILIGVFGVPGLVAMACEVYERRRN